MREKGSDPLTMQVRLLLPWLQYCARSKIKPAGAQPAASGGGSKPVGFSRFGVPVLSTVDKQIRAREGQLPQPSDRQKGCEDQLELEN